MKTDVRKTRWFVDRAVSKKHGMTTKGRSWSTSAAIETYARGELVADLPSRTPCVRGTEWAPVETPATPTRPEKKQMPPHTETHIYHSRTTWHLEPQRSHLFSLGTHVRYRYIRVVIRKNTSAIAPDTHAPDDAAAPRGATKPT